MPKKRNKRPKTLAALMRSRSPRLGSRIGISTPRLRTGGVRARKSVTKDPSIKELEERAHSKWATREDHEALRRAIRKRDRTGEYYRPSEHVFRWRGYQGHDHELRINVVGFDTKFNELGEEVSMGHNYLPRKTIRRALEAEEWLGEFGHLIDPVIEQKSTFTSKLTPQERSDIRIGIFQRSKALRGHIFSDPGPETGSDTFVFQQFDRFGKATGLTFTEEELFEAVQLVHGDSNEPISDLEYDDILRHVLGEEVGEYDAQGKAYKPTDPDWVKGEAKKAQKQYEWKIKRAEQRVRHRIDVKRVYENDRKASQQIDDEFTRASNLSQKFAVGPNHMMQQDEGSFVDMAPVEEMDEQIFLREHVHSAEIDKTMYSLEQTLAREIFRIKNVSTAMIRVIYKSIFQHSQELVPVKTGALQRSGGYVTQIKDKDQGKNFTMRGSIYYGLFNEPPYAAIVHEREDYNHQPSPRTAKYLEKAINIGIGKVKELQHGIPDNFPGDAPASMGNPSGQSLLGAY